MKRKNPGMSDKRGFKWYFRGFTLVELLVSLTIVAILGGVAAPMYLGSQKKAKMDNAISRAAVLDMAKANFLESAGSSAWDSWDNADAQANPNQEKYTLLVPFLSSGSPSTLGVGTPAAGANEYTPAGFRYTLNGLKDMTTVTDLSNNVIIAGGNSSGIRIKIARTTYTTTNLSVTSTAVGGVVAGAGTYATNDTNAILTAYPRLGYVFVKWQGTTNAGGGGGWGDISTNSTLTNPFTLGLGTTNTRYYNAIFAGAPAATYTLTVITNPAGGGTITGNTTNYTAGTNAFLTSSPSSSYTFERWFGTGGLSSTSTTVSFLMDQNKTVYANFLPPTFNVVMNSTNVGTTIPAAGTNKYLSNSMVTLTAIASNGYFFKNWSGIAGSPTNNPYVLTVTSSNNITPVFSNYPTSTLTVSTAPSGYGTTSINSTNLYQGQTINISAFPGVGKLFDKWVLTTANGASINDQANVTTTFTMGTNAGTLVANFKNNMLASQVITVGTNEAYIQTIAVPSEVGITTPNGYFTPNQTNIPIAAEVSANFPDYRFVSWVKTSGTGSGTNIVSTQKIFNTNAPSGGILDQYTATFAPGVNKFAGELPTGTNTHPPASSANKPWNSVLSPDRMTIYSAVGTNGVIMQSVTNTNPASITNICLLKYPTNASCMAIRPDITGGGSPGLALIAVGSLNGGVKLYAPPGVIRYDTSTNAVALNFPQLRDIDFDASGTNLYVAETNKITRLVFSNSAWVSSGDVYNAGVNWQLMGICSFRNGTTNTGTLYSLWYDGNNGAASVWSHPGNTISSITQITLPAYAGEQYVAIRQRPGTSELHLLKAVAVTPVVRSINTGGAMVNVGYTVTGASIGAITGNTPVKMAFASNAATSLIIGTPGGTISVPPTAAATTTFVNTYGAVNSTYGLPRAIATAFGGGLSKIWSIPGTNNPNGFAYYYDTLANGQMDTSSVRRAQLDARGVAIDSTGQYLYVSDYYDPAFTSFTSDHLVPFNLTNDTPNGTAASGGNSPFITSPVGIVTSTNGNIYYAGVGNNSFGFNGGIIWARLLTNAAGSSFFVRTDLPGIYNIAYDQRNNKIWANSTDGINVASYAAANGVQPKIDAFSIQSGGVAGIAIPSDGNEILVSTSNAPSTLGVYNPQTGALIRNLSYPIGSNPSGFQGIYYDDVTTNAYVSDYNGLRILKFGFAP